MNNRRTLRTLKQLHNICKAGERGFNIVANSVSNRGLKVMLKSYARERRQMADELKTMVESLGGNVSNRRSLLGMIHRGRIVIMSTLAIGPTDTESVALKEAVVGEKTAVRTYRRALNKDLMPEARALVQNQYEQVQAASQKVDRLRGLPSDRLVVRLFNSERDAATAVNTLKQYDFSKDAIEKVNLNQTNEFARHYRNDQDENQETTLSGMVGGAIWGSLLGAAAGIGFLLFSGFEPFIAATQEGTWGLVALSGTFSGAFIGGLLGFFIGLGTAEEDEYLYDDSMEHGRTMVLLHTTRRRAPEASQIMQQVNLQAATVQPTQ